MNPPTTLATFRADRVSLKRGARVIWEDASWSISGPTVLLGANGSGKSSTLAMLAGQLAPDQGLLEFRQGQRALSEDEWMKHVTLAAPWMELPGHLTLLEALDFHGTFRTPRTGELGWTSLVATSGLRVDAQVPVRAWSSGQRQRLALALALGTQTSAVLLDEPASNLDHDGITWFQKVLASVSTCTTVVVATNDEKKEAPKGPSLLRI
jgi:ABC-type multidrug transport system ATPase subunit